MEEQVKPTTVRIPRKTMERLRKEAKRLDRSVSWLIRHILESTK